MLTTANTSQNSFTVYRGDDFEVQLKFEDENKEKIPITGWTIWLTLKRKKNDPDSATVLQQVVTTFPDAESGIALVQVDHEHTNKLRGLYYYDFQFKNAAGRIQTITGGGVTFLEDITRAE